MDSTYSNAVKTAREYYNSDDADRFYHTIWGGEDIHIGWYEGGDEPISVASRRTVERMAERAADVLDSEARVLDLGAGYGGAARYLAKRFECSVVALNLSEAENERNRELTSQQSLTDKVQVVDGNFEHIRFADQSFDLVWSQDAILHSGDRGQVLSEVARVLKPGGHFIFTDPMQNDTCPLGVLDPILSRIHLDSLASPSFYREDCHSLGLHEVGFDEATRQLVRHYSRVLQETDARQTELSREVSTAYIERMKAGLRHWIEGGENGYLTWGIFHFQKTGG
jgi:sarcosine/dimethylglycine N-methyltransferase